MKKEETKSFTYKLNPDLIFDAAINSIDELLNTKGDQLSKEHTEGLLKLKQEQLDKKHGKKERIKKSFNLTKPTVDLLEEFAFDEDLSQTQVVERAILQYVTENNCEVFETAEWDRRKETR